LRVELEHLRGCCAFGVKDAAEPVFVMPT